MNVDGDVFTFGGSGAGGRERSDGDNRWFMFMLMFFVEGVQGAHFFVTDVLVGLNLNREVLDVTDGATDVTEKIK